MNFSDFTGEVQHRIEEDRQAEAVRATRAVLTTLGERLQPQEAADVAAPLPMEIDRFLLEADSGQRFGFDEFVSRVAERDAVDEAEATYRAQAIMDLVWEVEPPGEDRDVRGSLPADYEDLFEFVDADRKPWDQRG